MCSLVYLELNPKSKIYKNLNIWYAVVIDFFKNLNNTFLKKVKLYPWN